MKRTERLRFQDIDTGKIGPWIFLRPCTVKILLLVGEGISFSPSRFGPSEVLNTLRNNPEWWVRFDITRAHRQTDPTPPVAGRPAAVLHAPHHENFKFTQSGFDINEYDQVWFYGFNISQSTAGTNPPALTDAELEILFRWMDNGGGVFATGAPAQLGASQCACIPRVRNMRRWITGVPSAVGPDRNDTHVKGRDDAATPGTDESARNAFDDESDDVTGENRLRSPTHRHCHGSLHHHHRHRQHYRRRSPHPKSGGRGSPIDILPDRPHEGEVVQPTELTANPTFGGYTAPEYPDYGGSPLAPDIIAWARVQDDHGPSSIRFKGPADSRELGAIGTYNGHCVGVGRVVVDSAWHYGFDPDLTGRMAFGRDIPGNVETGDPHKRNGSSDAPQGRPALDRFRNYFRNVAIWLSPKAKLRCMVWRACWNALFRYPLHADLSADLPIWVIGHHAIHVLGKYASQCNVLLWWPVIFERLPLERLLDSDDLNVPAESVGMLDEFLMGGILKAMLEANDSGKYAKRLPSDRDLAVMAEAGARAGLKAMADHVDAIQQSDKNVVAMRNETIG